MKEPLKVVAAIIVHNNKVLCTQRNRDSNLGMKWEFPGGKIEANETPEDALIREIKEELNCSIRVNQKVCTSIHAYEFATIELTGYFCELEDGLITLNEHEAMMWVLPENLQQLDWSDADKPIVKRVQELLR